MLILSRKKGQIVDIGPVAITVEAVDHTGISVRIHCPTDTALHVGNGAATASRQIEHQGEALIAIPVGSTVTIATPAGTTEMRPCTATNPRPGTVPLGFTAPQHVRIWRRELKQRGAA